MTAPPPAGVNLAQRRWIGRLIRLGLVVVTIAIVAAWFGLKRTGSRSDEGVSIERRGIDVQRVPPAADALGPGDIQIVSRDGAVNLILKGDEILAGLSPEKVAEIRAQIERSVQNQDSSGLGAMIAQTVKKTVADTIGTHVVYPVANIRDIRIENDEIVIEDYNGKTTRLFGNTRVNNEPVSRKFDRAEAERFVELVRARIHRH